MNLNTDLYKRFGLEIELNKTQKGFCVYVRNFAIGRPKSFIKS